MSGYDQPALSDFLSTHRSKSFICSM